MAQRLFKDVYATFTGEAGTYHVYCRFFLVDTFDYGETLVKWVTRDGDEFQQFLPVDNQHIIVHHPDRGLLYYQDSRGIRAGVYKLGKSIFAKVWYSLLVKIIGKRRRIGENT